MALGVQLRAVVQIPPTKLRIDRTFCVRDTYRFKMSDRCGRTCLTIATFPGKRCDLSQLGQEDGGLLSEMRMGLAGNVCQQSLMEVNCGHTMEGPPRRISSDGCCISVLKGSERGNKKTSSEWKLMRHLPSNSP